MAVSGRARPFDPTYADGCYRRYPAVGARVETGPESTCSTRLCRTRRVAGEALPAVDQTMRHNPALGIMTVMPISAKWPLEWSRFAAEPRSLRRLWFILIFARRIGRGNDRRLRLRSAVDRADGAPCGLSRQLALSSWAVLIKCPGRWRAARGRKALARAYHLASIKEGKVEGQQLALVNLTMPPRQRRLAHARDLYRYRRELCR